MKDTWRADEIIKLAKGLTYDTRLNWQERVKTNKIERKKVRPARAREMRLRVLGVMTKDGEIRKPQKLPTCDVYRSIVIPCNSTKCCQDL